jgi:FkbH-like protein
MRALLLSNINMQPLVSFLKPWEVNSGEFNSILLDLANPASPAASAEFSHILCLYDTDALLGDALYGEGAPEQCESLLAALESYCIAHPEKIVVANTFCIGTGRWLNFADLLHPQSLRAIEIKLNDRLIAIAKANPNLLLIDTEMLFRRHGEEALLSPAFWYAGRIRYSNPMFRSLATTIHQAVDAYANRSRKVLVLDLDNTLWGGILGEVGPLGVALSEDGEGRSYRDFQRLVRAAKQTGVLLAICSKNNPGDLEEAFDRNSMMVLKREDFACIRANWEPKPQNILEIAETLNLGVDSFVFIDDNPVERDLISKTLPEVAVPEFPSRIENLPGWFAREVVPRYFGKYTITTEDRDKTSQYRANEARRQMASNLDLDSFLADLEIECALNVDPDEQINRIAQMTQKTNQFNLTTRRYEIPEIRHFLESPDHAVILLEYKDRFGSEGAVGLTILNYAEARIDTLLMSCRVIGRKVEDRLLAKAYELFKTQGLQKISGEFIPTRKNQQVARFYDTHGFNLLSEQPDGRRQYEKLIS